MKAKNDNTLIAPFPYFGGKSKIASTIWEYLGDPEHYIEPFFGSGAVLLARPNWEGKTETVCELDPYLANTWRALKYKPEETAEYCDYIVSHIDLHARRKYLMDREEWIHKMIEDPEWCDVRMAGYWIYCACSWVGKGVLKSNGTEQVPHLANKGRGINKITLGQISHLGDKGRGINKATLYSENEEIGVSETISKNILNWFSLLQNRLRRVRIVCGDWSRVCGGNWQDYFGVVGIYFDPPYSSPTRDDNLYYKEDLTVSKKVAQWALERGKKETYRIVISGYDDEEWYKILLDNGWEMVKWEGVIGYGAQAKKKENLNRHKEVLYISPYCIRQTLF